MSIDFKRALQAIALLALSRGVGMSQTPTARIVITANSFLSTLDAGQRQNVSFAFDDEEQRRRWSNFPISIVPRAGLGMKDMNPAQRAAAMALVGTALSPRGFEKVQQIMAADEALKTTEGQGRGRGPGGPGGPPPGAGPNGPPQGRGPDGPQGRGPGGGRGGGRGSGGGLLFGSDLYFISILGTPSEKKPWMLQFGGHHLAVNLTIDGERGILTPTLTGAQPALYTENGKTIRPLGRESDKAVALLESLDEGQRKQAVLGFRSWILCWGPGRTARPSSPKA